MLAMNLVTIFSKEQDLIRNRNEGIIFFYLTNKLPIIFDILPISFAYLVSYLSIDQVNRIEVLF